MGWAKYCEDNISIYNDRIIMAQHNPIEYRKPQANNVIKPINNPKPAIITAPKDGRKRNGLELSFRNTPDRKTITKLRLNGWWWSNARSCWCNTNTDINRRFIQKVFYRGDIRLVVNGNAS